MGSAKSLGRGLSTYLAPIFYTQFGLGADLIYFYNGTCLIAGILVLACQETEVTG